MPPESVAAEIFKPVILTKLFSAAFEAVTGTETRVKPIVVAISTDPKRENLESNRPSFGKNWFTWLRLTNQEYLQILDY